MAVYKMERAILDWRTAICFDRVFERFPGVRVASVENGAAYLHDLFHMEGLEYPAQIFDEIGHMSEADQQRIAHDNAAELTGVAVSA